MLPGSSTIAAIATPPGTGGIAVVRLSGPDVYAIAPEVFKPINKNKLVEKAKGYSALYGHFEYNGKKIDDGVALFFRAPHSYTGENVIELSCHGGAAVTQLLLEACLQAGAQPAAPGEFTRRAVLNGRISLTEAEAVMDLIAANTRQGAAMAEAALQGALQKKIQKMKENLISLSAHLTAWTDYPEEDVEELEWGSFTGALHREKEGLDVLVAGYDRGALVRRGINTVIVGSPNVGKSTLFNLLSGFRRAIVTPIAGTTRDVVREQIQMQGIPLNLADTAGLHESADVVEAEGIRRSRQEMEKADLILAVFDASLPLGQEEQNLAQQCAGRPALAILNKSDLGEQTTPGQLEPFFQKVVVVSAAPGAEAKAEPGDVPEAAPDFQPENGTVRMVEDAVLEMLQLRDLNTEEASLANQRQFAAAVRARDALADAIAAVEQGLSYDAAGVCLDDAIRALSALTGDDATEDVLNAVFSRFCVGK